VKEEEEKEDMFSKMKKEIENFGITDEQPPFDPNRFSVQQHSSLDDNNNNNNSFYQDCNDKQPPIFPPSQNVDMPKQQFQQPLQQSQPPVLPH
jgi:hypothetical protein